ncbi:hypothetical protein [Chitinophaga sp.]|uniref:hypothetical protein n=1 Tax=Chitinophaga sp. TaxID=1869181 RepID=UPI002C3B7668|nr:hypothetical protein [Chitinophaga sp.]HWV66444.1 hypothetical protein [Chitinophaga sp.]
MRSIKIFLFLLTFALPASATDAALAKILAALSTEQSTLLYQYGTLNTWATPVEADSFWRVHQPALGAITPEQGKVLATELLNNTTLAYTIKKPSRLQALRGVFTASRLLLGLAALVAAFAAVQLIGRYLPGAWQWLLRHFYPLFRRLFSPQMLSWELLVVALAGIYLGPLIPDLVIRTIVIHVGLVLFWTQLTAILTRRYFAKQYTRIIVESFEDYNTPLEAFLYVSIPALLTSTAVWWVMQVCPDAWYPYEVIVPAMVGVFTLPPLRGMEKALSRLLFPFTHERLRAKDQRAAAYMVISLVVWVALLLLPILLPEALLVLTIFLTGAFLLISIADVIHSGGKNYIWLQLLTLGFLFAVVITGAQLELLLLTWTGMGGLLLYVLIKYWEVPVLLGWSWKNKKAWGALGMALLIWGIAVLIRSRPEWFTFFQG